MSDGVCPENQTIKKAEKVRLSDCATCVIPAAFAYLLFDFKHADGCFSAAGIYLSVELYFLSFDKTGDA